MCCQEGFRRPDTQHSFPETLDKQLTNTLIRILYASWLQREERVFLEPRKAPTQKTPFLSFFHKLDMGEYLNRNGKIYKQNYYSYESSWWFGISF